MLICRSWECRARKDGGAAAPQAWFGEHATSLQPIFQTSAHGLSWVPFWKDGLLADKWTTAARDGQPHFSPSCLMLIPTQVSVGGNNGIIEEGDTRRHPWLNAPPPTCSEIRLPASHGPAGGAPAGSDGNGSREHSRALQKRSLEAESR